MIHQVVRDIFYEYVRARQDAKQRARGKRDAWSLSGTGSCMRQNVMHRAEYEEAPRPDESLAVFEAGDMYEDLLHRALQDRADAHGYRLFFQVRVTVSPWNAMGTLDFLIQYADGTWGLKDGKTANAGSMHWLRKNPSDKNVGQVTGYCQGLALGEHEKRDGLPDGPIVVNDCELCYMDKENGGFMDRPVLWKANLPMVEEYYQKLNLAWSAYKKDGTLPDEVPFQQVTPHAAHRKEGRALLGAMAPHPLCHPKYCSLLPHCSHVKSFWQNTSEGRT